ncbi:hypothetical protein SCOCK_40109 [Actinacidiphila cocklensis]|uniref:Uncharacterized protein n=1 Tax=Actinacidiphila cocklensis TaxID=887465 RepID=A0A9W4GT70_9ACTN|nr:hypothetical protein SCOCK_40109 [Actinacidiphila cocklensis]
MRFRGSRWARRCPFRRPVRLCRPRWLRGARPARACASAGRGGWGAPLAQEGNPPGRGGTARPATTHRHRIQAAQGILASLGTTGRRWAERAVPPRPGEAHPLTQRHPPEARRQGKGTPLPRGAAEGCPGDAGRGPSG